jgi:hypothetical protein
MLIVAMHPSGSQEAIVFFVLKDTLWPKIPWLVLDMIQALKNEKDKAKKNHNGSSDGRNVLPPWCVLAGRRRHGDDD